VRFFIENMIEETQPYWSTITEKRDRIRLAEMASSRQNYKDAFFYHECIFVSVMHFYSRPAFLTNRITNNAVINYRINLIIFNFV